MAHRPSKNMNMVDGVCKSGGATAHHKGNTDGGGSDGAVARGDELSQYCWYGDVFLWMCCVFVESNLDKFYAANM